MRSHNPFLPEILVLMGGLALFVGVWLSLNHHPYRTAPRTQINYLARIGHDIHLMAIAELKEAGLLEGL